MIEKHGKSEWIINDKTVYGTLGQNKPEDKPFCDDCSLYLTSAIQNRRETTLMRLMILSIS